MPVSSTALVTPQRYMPADSEENLKVTPCWVVIELLFKLLQSQFRSIFDLSEYPVLIQAVTNLAAQYLDL